MEGHPVVAPNRAARVSERFRDGTESRGHGTRPPAPSPAPPPWRCPPTKLRGARTRTCRAHGAPTARTPTFP